MKTKKVKIRQFYAIFQEESEGGYSVWVPSLPGCCSQGESFEETLEGIKEAVELYLEESPRQAHEAIGDTEKQLLVPVQISYA